MCMYGEREGKAEERRGRNRGTHKQEWRQRPETAGRGDGGSQKEIQLARSFVRVSVSQSVSRDIEKTSSASSATCASLHNPPS